jgi:hypothetical protein
MPITDSSDPLVRLRFNHFAKGGLDGSETTGIWIVHPTSGEQLYLTVGPPPSQKIVYGENQDNQQVEFHLYDPTVSVLDCKVLRAPRSWHAARERCRHARQDPGLNGFFMVDSGTRDAGSGTLARGPRTPLGCGLGRTATPSRASRAAAT